MTPKAIVAQQCVPKMTGRSCSNFEIWVVGTQVVMAGASADGIKCNVLTKMRTDISGSHGCLCEDNCLLGCYPDDRGSKDH